MRPQLYVELFHGRKNLSDDMEGWGEQGAIIGAVESVSFTYMSHIRLNDAQGEICDLPIVGDCIYWNGMYYGDFCIFHESWFDKNPEQRKRIEPPRRKT